MRIIVLRDAEIDIQDSIKWYNDKKRGLGHRFFQIIDHSFDFIAANPDLYPIVFSKVRKKVINGYPYLQGAPVSVESIYRTESHIQIYPNPASDRITVVCEFETPLEYQLVTLPGNVVSSGTVYQSEFNIDMSNFQSGFYFLKIDNKFLKVIKK
jgi:hypothetical protein